MMSDNEGMAKGVWGFCAWTAVLILVVLVLLWNQVAFTASQTFGLSEGALVLPRIPQVFLAGFPFTFLFPALPFLWLCSAQFMGATANHLRILTMVTFALNLLFLGFCGLSFAMVFLKWIDMAQP